MKTSSLCSYRDVKLFHNTFPLMYSAGGTGVEDWDECTEECSSRSGKYLGMVGGTLTAVCLRSKDDTVSMHQ